MMAGNFTMFSSLGVDNVRGRWEWGAEEGGAAAPSCGNYVTFWGKMLILIRATTEKTLQNNRSPQNADHADCRLQTADRADHAD